MIFKKLMALTPVTKIKRLKMDLVCQMVLIHYLEVLRPDQCFLCGPLRNGKHVAPRLDWLAFTFDSNILIYCYLALKIFK